MLCTADEIPLGMLDKPIAPADWVEAEFGGVAFSDDRLQQRLYTIVRNAIGTGSRLKRKKAIGGFVGYRKVSEVQRFCGDTLVVYVGDRDSDIYELFVEAMTQPQGAHLMVRSIQSRQRSTEQGDLWVGYIVLGYLCCVPRRCRCR